jgi:hypothetical protein
MQYYNYIIDRKIYWCDMFKDTCLVAQKRIDQSPRMFDLEILIYLILKSSYVGSGRNSPYLQAYNHINATIISIGID